MTSHAILPPCARSLLLALKRCRAEIGSEADALLHGLGAADLDALLHDWIWQARPDQLPPSGSWRIWAFIGGRGAGKTRAGAEWVRAQALGLAPFAAAPMGRIALVGETAHDVREVMIEGISGLMSVHPRHDRPQHHKTRQVIEWPNGALAQGFSADDPDALRGPQFHAAWCDELAKWRYGEEAFTMLQFALRLGEAPRQLVTTTPRPIRLLKTIMAGNETVITRAATADNRHFLAADFMKSIEAAYGGTRLGRQELMGEMIEEREDALFTRAMIERARVRVAPGLVRLVVAVDPPASSSAGADACGLVVAGRGEDGRYYILEDGTVQGKSPGQWAKAAISLYHRHEADLLVAEVNQGGEMVRAVIAQADASVPVQSVRATRGKYLRAEPVATLYEQGLVSHVGAHVKLEDEMCDFGPGGLSNGGSPDRLDALVWAITALMGSADPKIRSF